MMLQRFNAPLILALIVAATLIVFASRKRTQTPLPLSQSLTLFPSRSRSLPFAHSMMHSDMQYHVGKCS